MTDKGIDKSNSILEDELAAIPEISLSKGLSILDPTVAKMTSADSMSKTKTFVGRMYA